ncbi:MAG: (d)CMP kinase [Ignavibacteria bacterium]|nr:(d)CMP kinase [Ignavibacteria bacterium]
MDKKIVIAIDGPAGSGKSTTAKLLAQRLNYTYIDTGAMYRAITLYWLRKGLPLSEELIEQMLQEIKIDLIQTTDGLQILLNDENVTEEIRKRKVSDWVSPISAIPSVREFLVAQQRKMGVNGGIVMDGRDIGTVVFPHAELKIFLNASVNERTNRRFKEYLSKGMDITKEEVKNQILERDRIDSSRSHSPLRKAEDAIEIDTTNLTIAQQVELVYNLALEVLQKLNK